MTSLYCILARGADSAVIFRRGPSKQVRLIGWDLKKHTFQPGQWLKGVIYVRKSDLSPDGTKLVYFAAKHSGKLPTWIAVSKPPFLTALVLWRTIGTWNDLSLFETDTMLMLGVYSAESSIEPEPGFTLPRQLRVRHKPWPGYFHKLADHDRLVRDGWSVHSGDPVYASGVKRGTQALPVIYRKPVAGSTRSSCLQLSATNSGKLSYALLDDSGACFHLKADWADVHGKDIFYSQESRLLRIRAMKSCKNLELEPATELADFDDMKFEALESPQQARTW